MDKKYLSLLLVIQFNPNKFQKWVTKKYWTFPRTFGDLFLKDIFLYSFATKRTQAAISAWNVGCSQYFRNKKVN